MPDLVAENPVDGDQPHAGPGVQMGCRLGCTRGRGRERPPAG